MKHLKQSLLDFGAEYAHDVLLVQPEDCKSQPNAANITTQQLFSLQTVMMQRLPVSIAFQDAYFNAIETGTPEFVAEHNAFAAAEAARVCRH